MKDQGIKQIQRDWKDFLDKISVIDFSY